MSRQLLPASWSRRQSLGVLAVVVILVAGISGVATARLFGSDQRDSVATSRTARQGAATAILSASPSAIATGSLSAPTAPGRAGAPPVPTPSGPTRLPGRLHPAGWSSRQLAAVLVMTGAKMGDAAAIEHAAADGVGGIVLFGPSSPDLARTLTRARSLAPTGNPPLIASDEEGGQVQRLSSLIYPLPSAEEMGHWSPAKITATARADALKMGASGKFVGHGVAG